MKCTKCKTEKEVHEFPFKNKQANRRSTICGVCQREYKKLHYQNNKEDHYTRNGAKKERLRALILEAKSTGCKLCSENCVPCLDFHHKDPTKKEFLVSSLVRKGSLSKLIAELEKCVVLCANCHRKVHAGLIEL